MKDEGCNMTNTTLIVIVVAIIIAAAAVGMYMARRRANLKARFGPEYERVVHEAGSARRADATLEARTKRVTRYQIRALTREESLRFTDAWRHLQSKFVDDPAAVVAEADALVIELMTTRGYPMSEFDQ